MMRFKFLVILLLVALAGCNPKESKPSQNVKDPEKYPIQEIVGIIENKEFAHNLTIGDCTLLDVKDRDGKYFYLALPGFDKDLRVGDEAQFRYINKEVVLKFASKTIKNPDGSVDVESLEVRYLLIKSYTLIGK